MYESEYESYDIDISRIKNSERVCWQYTTEPPLEDEEEWLPSGEMYYKLDPKTRALAVASDYIHLLNIKPSNIMEWYYRLDALFDAGIGFIFIDTEEGEVPIRVTINDLKDHIGLRIKTNIWDSHRFDRYLRQLRMQNHLREML